MKLHMRQIILILLIVAVSFGVVWTARTFLPRLTQHAAHEKALYYCPMHPTYTSDRPGDCPICNMKLVKRESGTAADTSAISTYPEAKSFKNICYLHNCPKVHEGKPCPMLVLAKPGEPVTCPICGTHVAEPETGTAEKKILYWTDPMIPGFKSDKPGKSPMGMDLMPVYEEATPFPSSAGPAPSGYAPILVVPEKQQLIGVRTVQVGEKVITKTIRTVGTIAHDPDLYQAQAEYLEAIRALQKARSGGVPEVAEQAERLVSATRIRLKHMGLSDELIEEISARTEPDHSLLFAHAGGKVWMYAKVYEYELPLVHTGQEVQVEVPAISGKIFSGTIRAVDPMVDQVTRTTRIRAQLDDPEGFLKPDMYVNVTISVDLGKVLAVPKEAVFDTGTRKIIFVDRGRGVFEPREILVGVGTESEYEIKSGLAEGEQVVTSGNFLIDSESRLKGALQTVAEGHQHGA